MTTALRHLDLDALVLHRRAHQPGDRMCVLEATAYVAGEVWSDRPRCVSPVIAAFLQSWNDSLDNDARNRLLKPYVTKVIGTRTTDADEETRAWLATDWLVRVQAPAWLELAGLPTAAEQLRGLTPLTSNETAMAAQETLDTVRRRSEERTNAARSKGRSEAWSGSAAGHAAMDAARFAAAAVDAARSEAAAADPEMFKAWSEAWSEARDAASYAAMDAAWEVALSVVSSAASDTLASTVESLQRSALGLLDHMIKVGSEVGNTGLAI